MGKLRKPSQHTIDLYNQLVAQQNKVRKQLLRIHKKAEETIPTGRLPALIIPKKARRISARDFDVDKMSLKRKLQAFWNRYKQAKEFFGQGIKSYLSQTVKYGYIGLWLERMNVEMGLIPEGNQHERKDGVISGYFTPQQLKEMNEDQRRIAEIYNFLYRLSPEVFLALLYRGRLLQFQFIYEEMKYGVKDKENSWSMQQADLLEDMKSRKVQMKLLKEDEIMRDEFAKERYSTREKGKNNSTRELTPSGKHELETVWKADKKYQSELKKGGK